MTNSVPQVLQLSFEFHLRRVFLYQLSQLCEFVQDEVKVFDVRLAVISCYLLEHFDLLLGCKSVCSRIKLLPVEKERLGNSYYCLLQLDY